MARIAAPIVVISVGIQAMGVVDTIMVGRLGGYAIAAVALGNFYFFNITIFGVGLLFALDPIIAQAVGAGDRAGIARGVQRGMVVAFGVALVIMAAMIPAETVLSALNQPDDVIDPTSIYLHRRLLGVFPFLLFAVWRQALQAIGAVRPIIIAVIIANIVNALGNYAFVHGNLGMPALGILGAGWTTALSQWAMATMVLLFSWPVLGFTIRPWRTDSIVWEPIKRMLLLGAPIGSQWFMESFAFGLTTLFMGWMGTASLAGHEIALNMASLTFMVTLGISGAAAAVVGRAVGRGDMEAARRDATAAIICGVSFMVLSAAAFILAPGFLISLYTTDVATVAVAMALVPIAGVFQVFDGSQAVTSGVLRGTGDTRVPAILHMVAFWAIGIPLGCYLGFVTPLRERGLWWGLTAGLAAAAFLQAWRVRVRLRGNVVRVQIDTTAT